MVDVHETLRRAAISKYLSAIWAATGAFIGGSAAQTLSGGAVVTACSLAVGAAFGIGVGKLIDGFVPNEDESSADRSTLPRQPQVLELSARQTLEFKDRGPTNG